MVRCGDGCAMRCVCVCAIEPLHTATLVQPALRRLLAVAVGAAGCVRDGLADRRELALGEVLGHTEHRVCTVTVRV